jgi:acid phosphatase
VLTIVEENHSLAQMKAGMPYLYGLAQRYGYANNWAAIRHPSLPNYLAVAGGDTFGVVDDGPPSAHPVRGSSVFGQARNAGRTARVYAEGMTSNCLTTSTGRYAVKHNPWAYFVDERSACTVADVPVGTPSAGRLHSDIAAGALPNAAMVVPDLCNDAHDCPLATADGWLKSWLPQILAGPDFKAGRLAVVVTADEDDSKSGNLVLTAVLHPSLDGTHKVVTTRLTHYSLTRFYDDVLGVPRLRNAATAPSMSAAFGL